MMPVKKGAQGIYLLVGPVLVECPCDSVVLWLIFDLNLDAAGHLAVRDVARDCFTPV